MSSLYYLSKTNQSVQSPRKPIVNVLNKFSLITFLLIVGFVGLLFPLDLSAQKIDREQLLKDIQILSADDMEGRKAGTAGGEKARQYLIGRFRDNHILSYDQGYEQPFSFNTFRSNERYENNVNLIGYIEGEIEDIIVVSAHYDHIGLAEDKIYNGADDNASGVSAMLAIAAYFKENKPRHTIVFAAFDAEEQGKKGAIYCVSKRISHYNLATTDQRKVLMIGRIHPIMGHSIRKVFHSFILEWRIMPIIIKRQILLRISIQTFTIMLHHLCWMRLFT